MLPTALLTLATLQAPGALAWGSLGHETVAFLAQRYVHPRTAAWARAILPPNSTDASYLASIATWADSYRHTAEGEFSSPLHYIDAEDAPPQSCNVDFDRDCGEQGCIVSAIANYTTRVQAPELEKQQRDYALRWLVHFLGDVQQPLHCEAFALGGNEVDVVFDGAETNLHSIWDTEMPEKLRGGDSGLSGAEAWAEALAAEIEGGKYAGEAEDWLEGLDVEDPVASAMVWARDANAFVCSTVMPDGAEPLESGDLYPEYYESAIGTIERQVAKGGYRLAAWLDAIALSCHERGGGHHWGGGHGKGGRHGREEMRDLSGVEFLPAPREMSEAKVKRAAVGWDCKH